MSWVHRALTAPYRALQLTVKCNKKRSKCHFGENGQKFDTHHEELSLSQSQISSRKKQKISSEKLNSRKNVSPHVTQFLVM